MLLNKKENFTEYNFEETKNNLLEVENIYDKNKSKILWPDIKIKFMQENWPNTFGWDFAIKEDIIKEALTLEQNKCIIDDLRFQNELDLLDGTWNIIKLNISYIHSHGINRN